MIMEVFLFHSIYIFSNLTGGFRWSFAAHIGFSADPLFKIKLYINKHISLKKVKCAFLSCIYQKYICKLFLDNETIIL